MPTEKQLENMKSNSHFVNHWYNREVKCIEDFIERASADPAITNFDCEKGGIKSVTTRAKQKILTLVLGMTSDERKQASSKPRIAHCADFTKRGKDTEPRWYARKLDRRDATGGGGVEEFNQGILDEHFPDVDFSWWKQ